jgi:hypothetical protein
VAAVSDSSDLNAVAVVEMTDTDSAESEMIAADSSDTGSALGTAVAAKTYLIAAAEMAADSSDTGSALDETHLVAAVETADFADSAEMIAADSYLAEMIAADFDDSQTADSSESYSVEMIVPESDSAFDWETVEMTADLEDSMAADPVASEAHLADSSSSDLIDLNFRPLDLYRLPGKSSGNHLESDAIQMPILAGRSGNNAPYFS